MSQRKWTGVLLVAALSLGGCESVKSRMKEREAVVRGWSPMTRERVAGGEIKPGDSFDMVYIALGSPGTTDTFKAVDGGIVSIWSYPKVKQRFESEETVGYEDVSEFNIATGQRTHYQIPNRQKVYSKTKQNGLQVIFREGVVSSVRWGGEGPPASQATKNQQAGHHESGR